MTVLRPKNAAEAVQLYAKTPSALPLAGGTDLLVSWNLGQLNGRTVIDLTRIAEWRKIAPVREGLRIGALATHREIQENPIVRREFPLLAQACATVGAAQIQNRGTLGGNLANASPAGDSFPPLSVYEPLVRAVSPAGRRILHFSELFAGVKKTTLRPCELIESVELHFPTRRPTRQLFRKVGTRAAQAISKVVAAGTLTLSAIGAVIELRFAVGSAATTVRRLRSAEGRVLMQRLTPEIIDEAVESVSDDLSPIDDIRSTRAYRLHAVRGILRRFLEGK